MDNRKIYKTQTQITSFMKPTTPGSNIASEINGSNDFILKNKEKFDWITVRKDVIRCSFCRISIGNISDESLNDSVEEHHKMYHEIDKEQSQVKRLNIIQRLSKFGGTKRSINFDNTTNNVEKSSNDGNSEKKDDINGDNQQQNLILKQLEVRVEMMDLDLAKSKRRRLSHDVVEEDDSNALFMKYSWLYEINNKYRCRTCEAAYEQYSNVMKPTVWTNPDRNSKLLPENQTKGLRLCRHEESKNHKLACGLLTYGLQPRVVLEPLEYLQAKCDKESLAKKIHNSTSPKKIVFSKPNVRTRQSLLLAKEISPNSEIDVNEVETKEEQLDTPYLLSSDTAVLSNTNICTTDNNNDGMIVDQLLCNASDNHNEIEIAKSTISTNLYEEKTIIDDTSTDNETRLSSFNNSSIGLIRVIPYLTTPDRHILPEFFTDKIWDEVKDTFQWLYFKDNIFHCFYCEEAYRRFSYSLLATVWTCSGFTDSNAEQKSLQQRQERIRSRFARHENTKTHIASLDILLNNNDDKNVKNTDDKPASLSPVKHLRSQKNFLPHSPKIENTIDDDSYPLDVVAIPDFMPLKVYSNLTKQYPWFRCRDKTHYGCAICLEASKSDSKLLMETPFTRDYIEFESNERPQSFRSRLSRHSESSNHIIAVKICNKEPSVLVHDQPVEKQKQHTRLQSGVAHKVDYKRFSTSGVKVEESNDDDNETYATASGTTSISSVLLQEPISLPNRSRRQRFRSSSHYTNTIPPTLPIETNCPQCNSRFPNSDSLIRHIDLCEFQYPDVVICCPCSPDSQQFSTINRLDKHSAKEHGGVKFFQCLLCKNRFSRISGLFRHCLNQHQLLWDPFLSLSPEQMIQYSSCFVCGVELSNVELTRHLSESNECNTSMQPTVIIDLIEFETLEAIMNVLNEEDEVQQQEVIEELIVLEIGEQEGEESKKMEEEPKETVIISKEIMKDIVDLDEEIVEPVTEQSKVIGRGIKIDMDESCESIKSDDMKGSSDFACLDSLTDTTPLKDYSFDVEEMNADIAGFDVKIIDSRLLQPSFSDNKDKQQIIKSPSPIKQPENKTISNIDLTINTIFSKQLQQKSLIIDSSNISKPKNNSKRIVRRKQPDHTLNLPKRQQSFPNVVQSQPQSQISLQKQLPLTAELLTSSSSSTSGPKPLSFMDRMRQIRELKKIRADRQREEMQAVDRTIAEINEKALGGQSSLLNSTEIKKLLNSDQYSMNDLNSILSRKKVQTVAKDKDSITASSNNKRQLTARIDDPDFKPHQERRAYHRTPAQSRTTNSSTKSSGGIIVQCNICNESFRSLRARDEHIRSKHKGSRVFTCKLCSSAFATHFTLRKHAQRIHVGQVTEAVFGTPTTTVAVSDAPSTTVPEDGTEKSNLFQCQMCPLSFTAKSGFNHHMIMSHRSSSAAVGNDNILKSPSDQQSHDQYPPIDEYVAKLIAADPNPSIQCCLTCREMFDNDFELTIHLIDHQRDKIVTETTDSIQFACPKCCRLFFGKDGKSYLKDHYNMIHLSKPSPMCEDCGAKFSSTVSFTMHRKFVKNCSKKSSDELRITDPYDHLNDPNKLAFVCSNCLVLVAGNNAESRFKCHFEACVAIGSNNTE